MEQVYWYLVGPGPTVLHDALCTDQKAQDVKQRYDKESLWHRQIQMSTGDDRDGSLAGMYPKRHAIILVQSADRDVLVKQANSQ